MDSPKGRTDVPAVTEGTTQGAGRTGRARRALALAVVCGVAAPAVALAALPQKNASFESHDHRTKGKNWHVQFEIGKDNSRVETLVAYSEQCKSTAVDENVPVSDAGDLAAKGKAEGADWEVTARFTSPQDVEGTFRMTNAKGCDTGPLAFKASLGKKGDGHKTHEHSGGGHADHNTGPKYPPIGEASAAEKAEAEDMRRRAHRVAKSRFPTYRAARNQTFKRFPKNWKRPLVFHLRRELYENDRHIFMATRPESLVYWWPRRGDPILLGYMFRVPADRRPAFGGPIPIYHRHPGADGKLADNQMTHVWLTRDLRSAWANCLPVEQLEKAIPRFKYEKPRSGVSGAEAVPCEPVQR